MAHNVPVKKAPTVAEQLKWKKRRLIYRITINTIAAIALIVGIIFIAIPDRMIIVFLICVLVAFLIWVGQLTAMFFRENSHTLGAGLKKSSKELKEFFAGPKLNNQSSADAADKKDEPKAGDK